MATTDTFTATGTWTCPAGVLSVDLIEVWGAGGGGGGSDGSDAGAGAGGGAYAAITSYAVTPGNSYTVTVGGGGSGGSAGGGSDGGVGGDSWFNSTVTVLAKGGGKGGGGGPVNGPGTGGSTASSVGTTKFAGGNGANRNGANNGGAGGGGAGATAGGGNATTTTGGTGTSPGGNGGAGGVGAVGGAGSTIGGGGGGGSTTGSKAGGAGARGEVRITYTPVNYMSGGSVFTAAAVTTKATGSSPVAGSVFTVAGGVYKIDDAALVAGSNASATGSWVRLGTGAWVGGSVFTARAADVYLGTAAWRGGSVVTVSGQVQGINDEKVYEYKMFDHGTGAYIASLPDVISDYDYPADINTPGNAIQVELGRTPDFLASTATNLITEDTSENIDTEAAEDILAVTDSGAQVGAGTAVDLNLDIEVWVYYGYEDTLVDETGSPVVDDTGGIVAAPYGSPKGLRLFSGYVSSVNARYGTQETVLLNCLPNGVELNQYLFLADDGVTVVVPQNSIDPSDIVRNALDSYNTQGGSLAYDDSTIASSITSVSYTFKLNKVLAAVQKAQELAPSNWWWYGDPATNKLLFRPIPSDVTHTFTLGKHIKDLDIKKTIEGLVNDFYFLGGDTAGDVTAPVYLFRHQSDATSITNYRRGLQVQTDQRVTNSDSADIIAASAIETNKNPRYQATCVVLAAAYEIETIEMGQLVGFNNAGNFIDDLQLQIVGLHYQPDYVTLKLDSLLPQPSKRLEDIKRNLVQVQTVAVPDTPS